VGNRHTEVRNICRYNSSPIEWPVSNIISISVHDIIKYNCNVLYCPIVPTMFIVHKQINIIMCTLINCGHPSRIVFKIYIYRIYIFIVYNAGIRVPDLGRMLGQMWRSLSEQSKEVWSVGHDLLLRKWSDQYLNVLSKPCCYINKILTSLLEKNYVRKKLCHLSFILKFFSQFLETSIIRISKYFFSVWLHRTETFRKSSPLPTPKQIIQLLMTCNFTRHRTGSLML